MSNPYPHIYFGDRLVNQEQARLSVMSSAVLYGLSVYTVFPVFVKGPKAWTSFRLQDHHQRLSESARIIGMDSFAAQWSFERFKNVIDELLLTNNPDKPVFARATWHVDAEVPGTRSRGLSTCLSLFLYDANPILKPSGVRLKTSVWRRIPDYAIPSRAKVNGAYVNSVLAKQDAIDSGYDDCIFLDGNGHVCELSAANIFIVRQGKLITPHTSADLLEGINRRTIIELAREDLQLEVIERAIDLTELYIADEVFATGTSANIAPVLEIDGRPIGAHGPGPITQQLQKIHSHVVRGDYADTRDWIITHQG